MLMLPTGLRRLRVPGLGMPQPEQMEMTNQPMDIPIMSSQPKLTDPPLPPGGYMLKQTGDPASAPSLPARNPVGSFEDGWQKSVRGKDGWFDMPLGASASVTDPYAQARTELGPQQRRGIGTTIKDVLAGLATGGLGGALLGGVKGGDIRYQNRLNERAEQIGNVMQLQRQAKLDDANQERLEQGAAQTAFKQQLELDKYLQGHKDKQSQREREYLKMKLESGLPLTAQEATKLNAEPGFVSPKLSSRDSYTPLQIADEQGNPQFAAFNRKTSEIKALEQRPYIKPPKTKPNLVTNPRWQERASEIRRTMPTNAQGETVQLKYDPLTGGTVEVPLSQYEIDKTIRQQLKSEGIKELMGADEMARMPNATNNSTANYQQMYDEMLKRYGNTPEVQRMGQILQQMKGKK